MFSLRRADRELLEQSGKHRDKLLLDLISRPRRLLATVLIGNESVNVAVSAVMAGLIDRYYGGSDLKAGLLASALALPLLVFFGEITPKTIALSTSMGWSRRAARPLHIFGILATPIRVVVRMVADLALMPLGGGSAWDKKDEISEEEFKVLVDAGTTEGEVDDRERRLIHKVFEFGDKTVADVMQRRGKVFALAYQLPLRRLTKEIAARGYSRVPIYDRTLDRIRGVLYAKDLVIASSGHHPIGKLSDLLHEPFFVPQSTSLERLFAIFKQGKTHMAIVVNEYGTLTGIVTIEDLLEELFGEIRDEREQQKLSPRSPPQTDPFIKLDELQ